MEAVGAIASILAIIDLSIKSAKGIRSFLSAFDDSPRTVAQLAQDVETLSTLLGRLSLCSFDSSSPATVASLTVHLATCKNTLSAFETLLKSLQSTTTGRADRLRTSFRTVWKDKDLEQARNRIRDCSTQLNLYLGLLQSEATARASMLNASTAETTRNLLQQILSEFGKVHDRLDNISCSTAPSGAKRQGESGIVEPEVMEACAELEESISRLSDLANDDGSTLAAEDAVHIIDDLERLIQFARDKVCEKRPTSASAQGNGNSLDVRRGLRMIGGMMYGAPAVAVNHNAPGPRIVLANLPEHTAISQKRLREEIDIGCGTLTIDTNKRRRLSKGKSAESSSDSGGPLGDVVANLLFRPKNYPSSFHISVAQGRLFSHSIQSIPRISINPIIPYNSPVFEIVKQGRIDEFRLMLAEGKTNVRVHDEGGQSLLHYSIKWPELCKLLIEAGLDVDGIATRQHGFEITPLIMAQVANHHDTRRLLLQNGADPLLDVCGYASPLAVASSEADISILREYKFHSAPFFLSGLNEIDGIGHTTLLRACRPYPDGYCNRSALELLVNAGADVQARAASFHVYSGFTCLHLVVYMAYRPSTNDELESLVYLIEQGVSVYAIDYNGRSVSNAAYTKNEGERGGEWSTSGRYRGDLWDAALATCGYDLLEFRKDYPRLPEYGEDYTRADFERLWGGIEHLCPYWDDCRWPEAGGDSDYWTDSDDGPSGLCSCPCHESCSLQDSDDGESHFGRRSTSPSEEGTCHNGVWDIMDLDNPWTDT